MNKTIITRFLSLTMMILACGAAAHAYTASYYATSSRLSSGHWVKIATDAEGIYQFTYDQLREMGFSNPAKVQVFGYGSLKFTDNLFTANAPDDLSPVATMHTDDGRILFFGQGDAMATTTSTTGYDTNVYSISRNYYDTRSYYFLSDRYGITEVPSKRAVTAAENLTPLTSHIHLDLFEQDIQNPIHGGIGYHGAQVKPGATVNFDFNIKNFSPTNSYETGSFVYVMAISSTSSERMKVTASNNVDTIASYSVPAWSIADGDYTFYNESKGYCNFRSSEAKPLDNADVRFAVKVPASSRIRYVAPDYGILRYPRANRLDEQTPCLVMLFGNNENRAGQKVVFPGVSNAGDIVVWHIDNTASIAAFPTAFDEQTSELSFVMSDNSTRRTVAFMPSATFPSAEVIGDVPAQNLHGTITPDMIIVTLDEFLPLAEKLAEAHRTHQGLDVNVVTQEQIFNEFSSGARDVMGIRRYAKMYYDRRPNKFKYIFFLGPCSYDNRCIQTADINRLITYQNTNAIQTRNQITNYASDAIFGMLANDYNHDNMHLSPMQVAVGRVPAITTTQAATYVNKAIRRISGNYDRNAFSRVLLLAGEGDRNTHLSHSEEVSDTIAAFNPHLTHINLPCQLYEPSGLKSSDAIRNTLVQEIRRGAGYLTYSGHGDPNFIGSFQLWNKSYASEIGYDNLPFVMLSSCDQFAFDRQENGLVETMLYSANGGALGGIGAARSVYITHNQLECVSVAKAYANSRPGDTYGDILLNARRYIIERYRSPENIVSAAMVNCLNYNLAGDPAIPVGAPEYSIAVTRIGDTTEGTASLKPLKPFTITGNIIDNDNVATGFNGIATVRILAPEITGTTHNTHNENNYKPYNVSQQFDILAETTVAVTNGTFETELTMPAPSLLGTNRIVITAVNDADGTTALGSSANLEVLDYNPADFEEQEFDAPEIKEFYALSPSFAIGDETPSTITVTAVIEPSSTGLSMSTSGIGTRTSLTLDDITSITQLERFITRNDDGTMTLSTTLEQLDEGLHSLTLTCVNNAGLVDRSTIDFVVVSRADRPFLDVEESVGRTEATITLENSTSNDNRLVITDIYGNAVHTATGITFPYKWDLKATDGSDVPDGHYTISLMIRDGHDYTHAHEATLVVVR